MNGSWLMGPVTTKTVKICSPTRVQCFFAQVFCHYFVPPKPWCTTKTDFFLSPLQVPFPLLNIYQISQPLLQNLKWTREIKHHWGVCWKQGEIYLSIYQTFRPCSIFSWGGTVVGCNIWCMNQYLKLASKRPHHEFFYLPYPLKYLIYFSIYIK